MLIENLKKETLFLLKSNNNPKLCFNPFTLKLYDSSNQFVLLLSSYLNYSRNVYFTTLHEGLFDENSIVIDNSPTLLMYADNRKVDIKYVYPCKCECRMYKYPENIICNEIYSDKKMNSIQDFYIQNFSNFIYCSLNNYPFNPVHYKKDLFKDTINQIYYNKYYFMKLSKIAFDRTIKELNNER